MWKNRSTLMFASSILCAMIVLLQMAMYAGHKLLGWDVTLNAFQICGVWLQSVGFYWLMPILNVVVAYTFARCVWMFVRQLRSARNARIRLMELVCNECTELMNTQYSSERRVIEVVTHPQPLAFTMGLLRPRIILSTGLLELLEPRELEAVVHHEMHHLSHRDPLKTFLTHLFSAAMWYIPILKWCHQQYKITRELLADHHAIEVMGTSAALGSALLKLVKKERQQRMEFAYVSFADTSINYRIRQILDPKAEPPLRMPLQPAVVSLHVVMILSALLLLAVR